MTKLTFKKIDFWLQFTGILVFFISSLIYFSTSKLDQVSFISFFLIAIWQVLSAIINFFWIKIHSKSRHFWQIISTFLVFLMLIACISFNLPYLNFNLPYLNLSSLLFALIAYFLIFTLFFSPILAIWYLIITWQELKEMEKIAPGK